MKKTNKMATLFNGHSHIDRRVYVDEYFNEFVKINGIFHDIVYCAQRFDVHIWIK